MQAFPGVWPQSMSLTLLSCLLLHPAYFFAPLVRLSSLDAPDTHASLPPRYGRSQVPDTVILFAASPRILLRILSLLCTS